MLPMQRWTSGTKIGRPRVVARYVMSKVFFRGLGFRGLCFQGSGVLGFQAFRVLGYRG